MTELFRYGKCIFARPNINNVDDMVEMMKKFNLCYKQRKEHLLEKWK